MDVVTVLDDLDFDVEFKNVDNEVKQSLKIIYLAYKFNNIAKDYNDAMSIYELLVKFLAKYFDIFDTRRCILTKLLRKYTIALCLLNLLSHPTNE